MGSWNERNGSGICMKSLQVCVFASSVLAGVVGWSPGALAADRYVQPSGSDVMNDCLGSAYPCQTIEYAVQVSAPGDVMHLMGTLSANNIRIEHDLTFVGDTISIIDNYGGNRHFRIRNGASVMFQDITLTGGVAPGGRSGGSILVEEGRLATLEVAFVGNDGDDGGAIACPAGCTQLDLQRTVFDGNSGLSGGAIFTTADTQLKRCTFLENVATDGGAVFLDGAELTVKNSEFEGNLAAEWGGSIFAHDNSDDFNMVIGRSYFGNNAAGDAGGALYLETGLASVLQVANSTFNANSALLGGAIADAGGGLNATLKNITMVANDGGAGDHISAAGTYELWDSILTGAPEECDMLLPGGNNLTDGYACVATRGPVSGFGPLDYHGGDTKSFALSAASNALEQVPSCSFSSDQRGAPRDAVCDIGAYERL